MSKSAGQSGLLRISAVLLPVLLLSVAAITWFASTSNKGAAVADNSALALYAQQAVAGNNVALDKLVVTVREQAPGGAAGEQARAILMNGDKLRAVNDAARSIEGAVNAMQARLADMGIDESPMAVQELRAGMSLLGTQLAALRGAPGRANRTSAEIGDTVEGLSAIVGALSGEPSALDVAPLADAATAGFLSEQMLVLRSGADSLVADAVAVENAASAASALAAGSAGATVAPGVAAGFPMSLIAPLMPWLPLGLLGVALALIGALLVNFFRDAHLRRAALEQADQNERNQQAILRLLDELGSLADGDLTVEATVTEDITGAIADSINYAIEALRELVTTIDGTAAMVDAATRQTETTAVHMNRSAQKQALEIAAATESITAIAASIEEVSGNAERSSDVARHSVDVAHKGGDAVRRTIEGMNTIRETIQDTSKRIKRLGESSQEIGNIVELINDIAEQTNILALNASIQASMAGEAGRGFAVVADEVQRLAERSTNATKQIEVLVRTIQADTNEAVVSMERSTTDVVGGALLAENAGAALDEIEQVSNQIASLVQNIYGSARQQSKVASDINRRTAALKEISGQTGKATSATTSSIAKLAQLAGELRKSVSGFRLPESANVTRLTRTIEPAASDSAEREAS